MTNSGPKFPQNSVFRQFELTPEKAALLVRHGKITSEYHAEWECKIVNYCFNTIYLSKRLNGIWQREQLPSLGFGGSVTVSFGFFFLLGDFLVDVVVFRGLFLDEDDALIDFFLAWLCRKVWYSNGSLESFILKRPRTQQHDIIFKFAKFSNSILNFFRKVS